MGDDDADPEEMDVEDPEDEDPEDEDPEDEDPEMTPDDDEDPEDGGPQDEDPKMKPEVDKDPDVEPEEETVGELTPTELTPDCECSGEEEWWENNRTAIYQSSLSWGDGRLIGVC